MILWDGACIVHVNISIDKLVALQLKHPEAALIAHVLRLQRLLSFARWICAQMEAAEAKLIVHVLRLQRLLQRYTQRPTMVKLSAPT